MGKTQDLIALISAAYAKSHPDRSGVFEVEELRCPVCRWIGHIALRTHFQGIPYPNRPRWLFTDNHLRVVKNVVAYIKKHCPICHGTGYRPPDRPFMDKWFTDNGFGFQGGTSIHWSADGKVEKVEYFLGVQHTEKPKIGFNKSGIDMDEAYLKVFLAVLEKEKEG